MKINDYNATLDEKMSEFDMWVTPSLGEIRDTPQFRVNLEQLKKGFDYMADITENFADVSHCSSKKEWVLAELSFDLKFALHSSESTHDICSS